LTVAAKTRLRFVIGGLRSVQLLEAPIAVACFPVPTAGGDYDVGAGAVICQAREPYPVTATVKAVPVWSI